MTDIPLPPSEIKPAPMDETSGKGEGFFHYLAIYALAVFVSLATSVFWQTVAQPAAGAGQPAAALSAKLAALESRVARLEAQAAQAKAAPQAGSEMAASAAVQEGDIEKLKAGLADFSGVLNALQTQMDKATEATNAAQAKAEAGAATVIAYVRLERAARFGQPFEKERQAMRRMASPDPELVETLMKMEPLALKGAASLETLRADWRAKEPAVQSALRKAGAKTWQDRILVALQALVSIRSPEDQAHRPLSLEAVEIDLDQGRLADVLQKTASFPPEALALIAAWRAQVEARLRLDAALDEVAARLIGRGGNVDEAAPPAGPPASSTEAAPAEALPDIAPPSLAPEQRNAP